jgi:hypothetical protein
MREISSTQGTASAMPIGAERGRREKGTAEAVPYQLLLLGTRMNGD